MIALYIVGGILLLIFLLLALPLVKIRFVIEKEVEYKVTVAGITVLVQPESEKRKQKKLKRQKKQELKELKRLKKRQNARSSLTNFSKKIQSINCLRIS